MCQPGGGAYAQSHADLPTGEIPHNAIQVRIAPAIPIAGQSAPGFFLGDRMQPSIGAGAARCKGNHVRICKTGMPILAGGAVALGRDGEDDVPCLEHMANCGKCVDG